MLKKIAFWLKFKLGVQLAERKITQRPAGENRGDYHVWLALDRLHQPICDETCSDDTDSSFVLQILTFLKTCYFWVDQCIILYK